MISCVFKERESRDKAARKKTSSSVRLPRSLSHQFTLDSLHPPKTKDSYQRPLDHSFWKDFRPRPSSSSKGQSYVKDKQPASQPICSGRSTQFTGQSSARKDKDKGSQQYRSFHKKGRGGGGGNQCKYDGIASSGRKLSLLTVILGRAFLKVSPNSLLKFSRNSDSLRRWCPNTSLPTSRVTQPQKALSGHRRSEGYCVTGLLQLSLSGQDKPHRCLSSYPCSCELSQVLSLCYASAFRRRRHYVFGLSVRPSVRPKPEIPSFDLYMGPLVHPTNRNRLTACPSVRPSVRPSVCPSVCPSVRPERFPGICRRMHGGIGLTFYMLMYLDHLQNWLVYGYGLLIFLILALFWLSEMGQILGFRAFPGEHMEEMDWNFAGRCILTTFRTD